MSPVPSSYERLLHPTEGLLKNSKTDPVDISVEAHIGVANPLLIGLLNALDLLLHSVPSFQRPSRFPLYKSELSLRVLWPRYKEQSAPGW